MTTRASLDILALAARRTVVSVPYRPVVSWELAGSVALCNLQHREAAIAASTETV